MKYHPYEVYRDAAQLVEEGWVRKDWYSDDDVCLLEAVRIKSGEFNHEDYVPQQFVNEIAKELWRWSPYFVLVRVTDKLLGHSMVSSITSWNDVWWRRKKRVMKVLRRLAAKHKQDWLAEQHTGWRSDERVDGLHHELAVMRERAERAERQVADYAVREQLNAELDTIVAGSTPGEHNR
jgi:hypothetical protein